MALNLNAQLSLSSGLTVESGAHIKVGINIPENDNELAIINLGVYKDLTAFQQGKSKIMDVINLPLSFYTPQDENIVDPIYVHELAINHISTNLGIDPSLLTIYP